MATTDAKSGFRLPWTADRSEHDEPAAAHADEPVETGGGEADPVPDPHRGDAVASQPAAEPAAPPATAAHAAPARKPSKFLADLTKAMQAAAEQAREQTLAQFQLDAKAFVELIHETSATEAASLRSSSDGDVAGIREWSKAEIARIREETERRITDRKAQLEQELERHAAAIESRIEHVHGAVTAFEREMAAFFERLLTESDPSAFASMAENLPEPPRFEDILPDAFAAPASTSGAAAADAPAEASADAVAEAVAEAPAAEAVAETPVVETVAPEDVASTDAGWQDAEAAAAVATEPAGPAAEIDTPADAPGWPVADAGWTNTEPAWPSDDAARAELDAAEAEAALAARAESFEGEDPGEATSFMDRLAGLVGGHAEDDAPAETAVVSTQVVVVGLVSVAAIASFKRHLTRLPGVEAVSVSSGPDGEFVFTTSHRSDLALADAIATMPGFGARVSGTGDAIHVTAHDPEADA